MNDVKTIVRTILINTSAITTLVPADRIFVSWPTTFETLPVIAYSESDNMMDDYADDVNISEIASIQFDIFGNPNNSVTPIAQEIDTAMKTNGWNREMSRDQPEPDTYNVHKIMVYSKKLANI